MFTGIIETVGIVAALEPRGDSVGGDARQEQLREHEQRDDHADAHGCDAARSAHGESFAGR